MNKIIVPILNSINYNENHNMKRGVANIFRKRGTKSQRVWKAKIYKEIHELKGGMAAFLQAIARLPTLICKEVISIFYVINLPSLS